MIKTGYVEKVSCNNNGIWSFIVDNVRYGTFKDEPKCKVGDYVSFEAEQKGEYWNAKARTIEPAVAPATSQSQAPSASPPSAPSSGSAQSKSTWVPDSDRQNSITYQSARKDALELTGYLLNKDLIDLGTKSKKADAINIVELFVDRFTERFYEDTKALKPATSRASAAVGAPIEKQEGDSGFQDDDLDKIPW